MKHATVFLFHSARKSVFYPLCLALVCWSTAGPAQGQDGVSVYADGFVSPTGLEIDSEGRVWVAEQGTGSDDSRISVITPDGTVYPFATGLRSIISPEGMGEGVTHLKLYDGDLWAVAGLTNAPEGLLYRFSLAGWSPGDPPLTMSDATTFDLKPRVLALGFTESNLYSFTFGPAGDVFIVDAAANALLRFDLDADALSVFATFADVPNPLFPGFGPPTSDAVPTKVLFTGDGFYVSGLSGFPFVDGNTNVYGVDLDGNVSILRDGLTLVTDIDIDPRDGKLLVLQFGRWQLPDGFLPGTGLLLKLQDERVDTLASGLNFMAGLHFGTSDNAFVASLFGQVLSVALPAVDMTPPECEIVRVDPGPPTTLRIRVRDGGSGLSDVRVKQSKNATVDVPIFPVGIQSVVFVTAEKLDESKRSMVILEVEDEAGNVRTCDPVLTTVSADLPEQFELGQNWPNPFNPTTRIAFKLAEHADVRLTVYDVVGREVATLVREPMEAGTYEVEWEGTDAAGRALPSGLYLYRITAGTFVETRTMTLLK
ncbi:MAG: ScyD/ScyE family protein [Rhodothermales bacterium]